MAQAWDQYLSEHEAEHLDALIDLLRIPSVSALPHHRDDVVRAAEWVADRLRHAGVPEVALLPTSNNPVVYGSWHVADDRPTALIYAHYDVQPADPLDLWTTPPFEPAVRNGRLYARGAADDKGGLLMPVQAIEAFARTDGAPPINVKFFFEGEEEIGSPSLPPFVHAERERLACDVVISADGVMWGSDAPSLTIASKGMCGCQIDLRAASSDLHSGLYGAAVPNAAQAIAHLVASFHTPEGRVAVDGFYDTVRDLTPEERAEIATIPFDEATYLRETGAAALWGEPGYSVLERSWARPTLDVNGIWGGFQGAGPKTVTPSQAHAKITCRLVPDQEPDAILDLVRRHVARHTPPSTRCEVERFGGSSRPFAIRRDHPALLSAAAVLRDLYGKEPLVTRLGGTLPVADIFQRELGADLVFFAWSMPDCQAHGPNEWYGLADFTIARRAYCSYLTALAG